MHTPPPQVSAASSTRIMFSVRPVTLAQLLPGHACSHACRDLVDVSARPERDVQEKEPG